MTLDDVFQKTDSVLREEKVIELLQALVLEQRKTNERLATIGAAMVGYIEKQNKPKITLEKKVSKK